MPFVSDNLYLPALLLTLRLLSMFDALNFTTPLLTAASVDLAATPLSFRDVVEPPLSYETLVLSLLRL